MVDLFDPEEPPLEIHEWLSAVAIGKAIYVKRLSGNDTLANESHQAGPYVPRDFARRICPAMDRPDDKNPDARISLEIASHGEGLTARFVWYNSRTRNEARITQLGGRSSPLLNPENTGAIAVFVFEAPNSAGVCDCSVWLCTDPLQEEAVEAWIGPVEPGLSLLSYGDGLIESPETETPCWLSPEDLPAEWIDSFPSGADLISKVMELRPDPAETIDKTLLLRRECEFELFRSLEEAVELPLVTNGYESVDAFIAHAQSILQRRKARAGRSLELHIRNLLVEAGFEEGKHFDYQPESEEGKRPDFLFPSASAYHDPSFDVTKLRMLAVKTTCKDRWRQVLPEADRIPQKHLLTLQEGVSEAQFKEMKHAGVQLVVPEPLRDRFNKKFRDELMSVDAFVESLT